MKSLLVLAGALALGACTHTSSSTADNNTVTVTTANHRIVMDDTAAPITAREAVENVKNE